MGSPVTGPAAHASRSSCFSVRSFVSNSCRCVAAAVVGPEAARLWAGRRTQLEMLEKVAEKGRLSVVVGEGGLAGRIVKMV